MGSFIYHPPLLHHIAGCLACWLSPVTPQPSSISPLWGCDGFTGYERHLPPAAKLSYPLDPHSPLPPSSPPFRAAAAPPVMTTPSPCPPEALVTQTG